MNIKSFEVFKPTSISVEGVDGAGKNTISNLIKDYLIEKNLKSEVVSFPQHGEHSGQLVDDFLYNGLSFEGSGLTKAYREGSLYAIDRMVRITSKDDRGISLLDEYRLGKIPVFDRYVTSNILHRAKMQDMDDRDLRDYADVMFNLEFNTLGIPKPDITFFLCTLPQVAKENIDKRGRETDENENLDNIQEAFDIGVSKLRWLMGRHKLTLVTIQTCEMTKEGVKMKKPEEILEEIKPYLDAILKMNRNL